MEPNIRALALYPFKPIDQLYLKFASDALNEQIVNKVSHIFLAANQKENDLFVEFIQKNYTQHRITDVNYSARKTLFTVWKIIKNDVNNSLELCDMNDEKKCQDEAFRELMKQGQLGKVFTIRQAKLFCSYAEMVRIPANKKIMKEAIPFSHIEKLYLKFIHNTVKNSVEKKCASLFLGATQQMHDAFICFAQKHDETIEDGMVNIFGIIANLTNRVQRELKTTINPSDIEDEKQQQKIADVNLIKFGDNNYFGCMLTRRQAAILAQHTK